MTPSISNPLFILIQWSTVKFTIGKIQQAEPIRCLYKQISNVCVHHPTQINLHIETQTLLQLSLINYALSKNNSNHEATEHITSIRNSCFACYKHAT